MQSRFVQRVLFPLVLAVAVLLPATRALAVALGDELILSRLGDPVEAEIALLQWEGVDMDRVQISAASQEEYATFRLTRLPVIDTLSFNVFGPNLDGDVRVLVSGREPLHEPFLELLLVLRWPGGYLLREYVLLFDPPGAPIPPANVSRTPVVPPEPASAPVIVEPLVTARAQDTTLQAQQEAASQAQHEAASQAQHEAALQTQQEAALQTRQEARTQAAIDVETLVPVEWPANAQPRSSRRTYQVRSGDTLWNIARQFQPAGAAENLFQVLVSLHDLNRRAFINGKVALLKADATLQLPDATDIARIDPVGAEALFNARWNEDAPGAGLALAGAALPLFEGDDTVADEINESTTAPVHEPGQEAELTQTPDDLVMAANSPTALQTRTPALAEAAETPLQTAPAALAESAAAPDRSAAVLQSAEPEPALLSAASSAQQGNDEPAAVVTNPGTVTADAVAAAGAEYLQQAMQTRAHQRSALQQQVDAMRLNVQQARSVAALLDTSLQRAQAERTARQQDYVRDSILLSGLALIMGAGLVYACVLLVRQARQLRSPRRAPAGLSSPAFPRPVGHVRASPLPRRREPVFHSRQQAAEDAVADYPVRAAGDAVADRPVRAATLPESSVALATEATPSAAELFDALENLRSDAVSADPVRG